MLFRRHILALVFAAVACGGWASHARAAGLPDLTKYEGRSVASVEVALEGVPRDARAEAALRALISVAPGTPFSAVRVRESLQALFESRRVANARVEAAEAAGGAVALRFVVRPQVRIAAVRIDLDAPPGTDLAADDIRSRLNLLDTGARLSDQALRTNADLIQAYLRDRGYFRAEVSHAEALDPAGTSATVDQGNLAPRLEDRRVFDTDRNLITVTVTGAVGPKVKVEVTGYELDEKKQRELLPVRREGTIDQSAIEEGRRRLQIRLQENGHFFPEVNARCSLDAPPAPSAPAAAATPPPDLPAQPPAQGGAIDDSCQLLNPQELSGRTVNILYEVTPGRRFRLTDIDIVGTDELTHEDIAPELRSQERNLLEFIPFLGYGRGFTSDEALARDQRTIRERMRELGYRQAVVEFRQGVSVDSDALIITFAVTPGPLTRVAGVEIRGNQLFDAKRLLDEPCAAAAQRSESCTVVEAPYARSLARADAERIRNYYARNGYVDSEVNASIVELPPRGGDEQVRVVYDVREGGKVFIDDIEVRGNVRTQREAILEALPLRPGRPLRLDELRESERILYNTNAFRQVIIRSERDGETASGFAKHDVIIDIEELKPRRMDYGGGYSTDGGPLGLFEIQHNNLFNTLRQGTIRVRASNLHQLLRLEYYDPRFRAYGQSKFSPLTISAQYQRDVSVTRFFRSTIDRGTNGIVQRLDEEGRPILVECTTVPESGCERTGEPTINRFTVNVESQRVLQEASNTILFVRYNYEDVRIFNFGSLLVAPILRPDRGVRLSRFGATLTRDTRDRQFDPSRGEFLTADFAVALKQLGGNISFSKLLVTYRRYWRLGEVAARRAQMFERRGVLSNLGGAIRQTIFAANVTLGAANLFNPRDRDGRLGISDVDRTLPISERFFSGGSNTLRGFGFEEAGPRLSICPGMETEPDLVTGFRNCMPGLLRDRNREQVRLNPFTVPVGGNALAIVNVEARVPVRANFQIVPFYDGGNVFRRVGDIFGRNDRRPGEDMSQRNLRVEWSHTAGLGLRFRTPLGALAVDYGLLLNPPEFEVPQFSGPPAIHRLSRTKLHFRFGQTF
ncbi:MAG: BamA/TamA family outer membrane protein [Acidobacteria bacterium]|nr:BamA/TamA family outer membrane protein [Acidobacteriota bacterium]